MIKIEIPKINDLKVIDKIALQVHEFHVKWRPDIFEHTDSIFSEEDLSLLIADENIFVAKIDNEVVGYILLSKKESKKNGYKYRREIDIDALGVLDTYRNQGIGFKLLSYVKDYAINNHYTTIKLTVNEENASARHLYEKFGFRVKNIAYSMNVENN